MAVQFDTNFAGALPLDGAIGVRNLKPPTRAQLLAEQIEATFKQVPMMAACSVLVSVLLLSVTMGGQTLPRLALWAAAFYGLMLLGLGRWHVMRRRTIGLEDGRRIVRRAAFFAAAYGLLWGFVAAFLLPSESDAGRLMTAVAVIGIFCAASFSLSILPVMAFSFALPLLGGCLWGLWQLGGSWEAQSLALTFLCFALTLPLIGFRFSRNFVRHLISESRIREQKDIISLLLKEFEENASDWLWEFDANGRMERVSDRFATAAKSSPAEMAGRNFCAFLRDLCSENSPIIAEIGKDIERHAMFHDVVIKVDYRGEEDWWRLTGKPTFDDLGKYTGYIGTASNITAERLAERKINFLAHRDSLTGLLNRSMFTEHLKQCVSRLERYGTAFTVLYLDLDQFKAVNDTRGHLIGDGLLAQVGKRIRETVRDPDVVARLGGDEFAIILTSHCDVDDTADLAHRLVQQVSQPYDLGEETVSIGLSVGIAMAPINGTRPDQIQRNADLALYRAKAEGRGTFRFFETQMDSDARERRMLELELRQALENEEFVLHFQPLVSAEDNRPSGFEALVRWNHPIRGIIAPSEFIPIAEQTGLIKQIGDWTIHAACRAAAAWPQDLIVAVNLSPKHFQLTDIATVVSSALDESGLPPRRLELEITESLLIEQPDEVVEKLTKIKQLGVTIAMDDFGTGYSSLSYLLKFPFDKIKIDQSFVTASSEDTVARDILRAIASLGKTLKISITAEGVETQEQVNFLREIACQQLQGYYFSQPLSGIDVAGYLLGNLKLDMDEKGFVDVRSANSTEATKRRSKTQCRMRQVV